MIKFETENSAYELDVENKRVRRLLGKKDPTPRQGSDGEWKTFVRCTDPQIDLPTIFVWNVTDEGICQSTMTSLVTSVSESAPLRKTQEIFLQNIDE